MTAHCSTLIVDHPVERSFDVWTRTRQFFCGLTGHDSLLTFDGANRIALKCQTCGHESPGFDNSDIPRPVRLRMRS